MFNASNLGSSIGGVIYPIMLNQLFNGKAGFAWGVRLVASRFSYDLIIHVPLLCSAAAFLGLFLLTIANLLMRTRLPSRKHRKTRRKR